MQIYNQENEKVEENQETEVEPRSFFPRSEMNDWTPAWEKVTFLLMSLLGSRLISFVVVQLLALTPLYDLDTNSFTTRGYTLANDISYFLLGAAFLLVILLDQRKTWKRILVGFKDKKTYIYGFLGVVAIYLVNLGFSKLYQHTVPFYNENANQNSVSSIVLDMPFLTFLPIVVIAPFVEELAYRIGIVDTVGHNYKYRWIGIVLSGIIFAFIHFDFNSFFRLVNATNSGASAESILALRHAFYNELMNLPMYMLPGMILAFVYAKSGNIATSMTAHFLNNLLSFISILVVEQVSNPSSAMSFFAHFIR